jgi:MerR family mercuric resistance operon transcriptional regulator
MTRGEISRQTDISTRTIRFYEDKGIIPIPERDPNGYRNYDISIISRLKFIKNTQQLGFSLTEIKELTDMKIVPDMSCESVHDKAKSKILDIEVKITELTRIKDALNRFTRYCSPGKGIEECEFLHLMENMDTNKD